MTPIQGRTMRPFDRSSSTMRATAWIGMAKPTPCANGTIAVLTPTTEPERSTRGPPLFPGLIAASVWIKPFEDEIRTGERATEGADNARRDGGSAGESECVSDREHDLSNPKILGPPEASSGQTRRFDLDEGEVGDGVAADDLPLELATVRELDAKLGRTLHDVLVRHEVPGGVDDHGGRLGLRPERVAPTASPHQSKAFDRGDPGSHRIDGRGDPRLEFCERHGELSDRPRIHPR